jgi:hypothetical protein
MLSILGPPPLDFLELSSTSHLFWDKEGLVHPTRCLFNVLTRYLGRWKGAAPIPETSPIEAEQRLEGEEQEQFLRLIKKMLQWKPEDRSSIEDVFIDE